MQHTKDLFEALERIDSEIRYLLFVKSQQIEVLKKIPKVAKFLDEYEKSKKRMDELKDAEGGDPGAV